uniref:Uncharacterized protein n=1 Tax=Hyaloperonospora arabidopsidis (strain Emoy2) TaxID=559515 RepID=M4BDR3_HYAAE
MTTASPADKLYVRDTEAARERDGPRHQRWWVRSSRLGERPPKRARGVETPASCNISPIFAERAALCGAEDRIGLG